MKRTVLPNELAIKQAIADRTRELQTLRSIARALERYRREHDLATRTRRELARTQRRKNEAKS